MVDENYGKWVTLKEEMNACKGCSFQSGERLLGSGNKDAHIMIVTDRPEPEESDEDGFAGEQGQTLKKYLRLINITPESVYKTSLVCCKNGGKLQKESVTSCLTCLRNQFRLVRPEIVVCVGKLTACTLIEPDFNLSRRHGEIVGKGKTMFIAVKSPLAVKYDKNLNKELLSDFMKLYDFCKTYPPAVSG